MSDSLLWPSELKSISDILGILTEALFHPELSQGTWLSSLENNLLRSLLQKKG
jgi:hypothetical protein